MTPEAHPAPDLAAVDELRFLADALRRVEVATAAAHWDDDALAGVLTDARAELSSVADVAADIGTTAAAPDWRERAADYVRWVGRSRRAAAGPEQAAPDAVIAVALARGAIAEAILAVTAAGDPSSDVRASSRRLAVLRVAPVTGAGRRIVDEVQHVVADKPRAILIRLLITLGISLSLVSIYHFSGLTRHDDISRLSLYLFSAVVGSVVCTNALCFEARRVRDAMAGGERIWRILVAKNLAMAVLITVAALPSSHSSRSPTTAIPWPWSIN